MHCWWCCHPIKEKPLHLPNSYDNMKKEYKVFGYFCSWNCMKAYNLDTNDSNMNNRMSLISLMYYDTYKTFKPIRPAPPRQVLKIFGGSMDIDEFRNISQDTTILANLPPLIFIDHTIEKYKEFECFHSDMCSKPKSKETIKSWFPSLNKKEGKTLLNFLQRI